MDGEYIYEQGKPGVALFLIRRGVVEITRRRQKGEEVRLLVLLSLPPPSRSWRSRGQRWFAGLPPGLVVRSPWWPSGVQTWMLSSVTSRPRTRFLKKVAQIIAMRLQTLVGAGVLKEDDKESKP